MKIVADKAIPFLQGVFEPYAEVLYKDGGAICADDVRDADAIVTRTRTKCNQSLLEGSKVSLIASATIGLDHVDIPWCSAHGITVMNAPGCNAGGVVQYFFTAIYSMACRKNICLSGKTIGIIGVGNVGSRIGSMATALGFRTLLNDPPREAAEGSDAFCGLDYLLEHSDIVTLHVPLAPDTRNMADSRFFRKMKPGAIFVNASRGEVVDEQALVQALPSLGAVAIDTWNHEPEINRELLSKVDIGTTHIAGYSYQGKQNGTAAAVRAVARYFGIMDLEDFYPSATDPSKHRIKIELKNKNQDEISAILQDIYPIFTDDMFLRQAPDQFEQLRKAYDYRNEFYIE